MTAPTDLRPGDVVELFRNGWPDGTLVRGALYEAGGWLYVAEEAVRREDGRSALPPSYTLTVISRAPRPLYVNHDRTEPKFGDVVRTADDRQFMRTLHGWLGVLVTEEDLKRKDGLTLLVDGETGEVVP